jgi:hypothetical protein
MATADILHHFIPKEILCQIFSTYLTLQDISRLDLAICSNEKRPGFLEMIRSVACIWPGEKEKCFSSEGIFWLRTRDIKIRHLNCDEAVRYGIYIIVSNRFIYVLTRFQYVRAIYLYACNVE